MMKHLKFGIAVLGFLLLFCQTSFSQTENSIELIIDSTTVMELDTVPLINPDDEILPQLSEKAIQEKLKTLQGKIPLKYNSTVKSFITAFVSRNREYVGKVAVRQSYYFPVFEKYLKKHSLPDELKYLSIVESALLPKAVSWASAVGLWQFIPSTGRFFGLRQDGFVDERMELHKSTEAACIYLKQLYDMFGNWELALASYNAGPGFVRRAIRLSGNKTDFWAIYPYLPRETRSYVPMFVAVMYVMNSMEEHGIELADNISFTASDTVMVNQAMSLPLLAKQLEVAPEVLQDMNPHLKKGIVPAYLKNCVVHIPKDKTDHFLVNRQEIMDTVSRFNYYTKQYYAYQRPTYQQPKAVTASVLPDFSTQGKKLVYYVVKNGDVLGNIASLHNVSVSALKAWNGLRGNVLWVGQKLSVWVQESKEMFTKNTENTTVSQKITPIQPTVTASSNKVVTTEIKTKTDNSGSLSATKKPVTASLVPAPPVKTVTVNQSTASVTSHTVQNGETLWNIAKRYSITVETIKKLNNITDSKLKIGQVLKVK
jgi:membrane-bound lytic murein transglycosylase D